MPAVSGSAPGKIILVGEHAVVYGQPALAVPVHQVQARVVALAAPTAPTGQVLVDAPDIGLKSELKDLPADHPIAALLNALMDEMRIKAFPAVRLKITSTIPVAAGMGSGAAVSVALARAVSAFLGHPLSDEQVNRLAYRVEMIHHGTPSGIDNTVITYGVPVYFKRGEPLERLNVLEPFHLVIGHSGIQSATVDVVSDVRRCWQAEPDHYSQLFEEIGQISIQARGLIEKGQPEGLGPLMDRDHDLLTKMGVSCPELDRLVEAARSAGALGAKLSGAGRGGNMAALVREEDVPRVTEALFSAHALRVVHTTIHATGRMDGAPC